MSDSTLSAQQLEVICALSSGATTTAAAEQAGVHRNTITTWRRNLLPFQRALADAQYDRAMLYREKMEDLVDLAVQAIQQILVDPTTPPSIRLKAALAIIQISAKPPEPKKQAELLIETIPAGAPPLHNSAQRPPQQAATFSSTGVHNPAQHSSHAAVPWAAGEVHSAAQSPTG